MKYSLFQSSIIILDTFVAYLASIPITIALIITLKNYRKRKTPHNLLFMLSWVCFALWSYVFAAEYIVIDRILAIFAGYMIILMSFFLVIFLDKISRENIDPIKITIVGSLAAIKIFIMLDPSTFTVVTTPTGQLDLVQSLPYNIVSTGLLFCVGCFYVYYMLQILRNAPSYLKRTSVICVGGAFLMGIMGPGMWLISVASSPVIIGLGALLTAVAFAQQPQLAYILPFRTYRLIVMDTIGGIPLFNHNWVRVDEEDSENLPLTSAMLQGVNSVLKESFHKGGVREIKLENATLIHQISEKKPFMSIILASSSSPSLRKGLEYFIKRFEEELGHCFPNIHRIGQFDAAEELISECFPFVPWYNE